MRRGSVRRAGRAAEPAGRLGAGDSRQRSPCAASPPPSRGSRARSDVPGSRRSMVQAAVRVDRLDRRRRHSEPSVDLGKESLLADERRRVARLSQDAQHAGAVEGIDAGLPALADEGVGSDAERGEDVARCRLRLASRSRRRRFSAPRAPAIGQIEREGGNGDREQLALLGLHLVGADHDAGRRRQRAAAGIGEGLARLQHRLLADHAGARAPPRSCRWRR